MSQARCSYQNKPSPVWRAGGAPRRRSPSPRRHDKRYDDRPSDRGYQSPKHPEDGDKYRDDDDGRREPQDFASRLSRDERDNHDERVSADNDHAPLETSVKDDGRAENHRSEEQDAPQDAPDKQASDTRDAPTDEQAE